MVKRLNYFLPAELLIVIVVALGYFVDAYDLLVFSAVRSASLNDLGVLSTDSMNVGLNLLNWQLTGLFLGGLLWGILADKIGRRNILFVSIAIYSIANLSNAFVSNLDQYAFLRFLAGLGLAGELGVGITLITENVDKNKRTVATTIVSVFGMLGATCGGYFATIFHWKLCFILGGLGGILLLLLRFKIDESKLFNKIKNESKVVKGNLLTIITNPRLLKTYLLCTLAGSVTFVLIGLFIQNTPEFGKLFGLDPLPVGGIAIIYFYLGAALAEILAGLLSKKMKKRKTPMYIFYGVAIAAMLIFAISKPSTLGAFYLSFSVLGLGIGYWTLLITTAAEQFGTNIRATAATSIPNVARSWSIPFSLLFTHFFEEQFGLLNGAVVIGIIAALVSALSVAMLKDNFEIDANFED